ncbi:MAG: hypothetical protein ACR2Q3_08390, partial [Woeseiaceae bacterium]
MGVAAGQAAPEADAASYIVQAPSLEIAIDAVHAVGGEVTHELGIINSVGATLSSEQLGVLSKDSRLKIQKDRRAGVADASLSVSPGITPASPVYENSLRYIVPGTGPRTFYPTLVNANEIQHKGILGSGVTVAVVDTGYYDTDDISKGPDGNRRILAQYDAIK